MPYKIHHLITYEKFTLFWQIGFWLVLASLLYLTLTASPPKPIDLLNIDKFYHFSAFAGFTFFFKLGYRKLPGYLILGIASLIGGAIEVAQLYIPNRGFSVADIAADIVGVAFGFWLSSWLLKINQSNSRVNFENPSM